MNKDNQKQINISKTEFIFTELVKKNLKILILH